MNQLKKMGKGKRRAREVEGGEGIGLLSQNASQRDSLACTDSCLLASLLIALEALMAS